MHLQKSRWLLKCNPLLTGEIETLLGTGFHKDAADPMGWSRRCLVNIAKAGLFSSDRTIAEYNRDTWHLGSQKA